MTISGEMNHLLILRKRVNEMVIAHGKSRCEMPWPMNHLLFLLTSYLNIDLRNVMFGALHCLVHRPGHRKLEWKYLENFEM